MSNITLPPGASVVERTLTFSQLRASPHNVRDTTRPVDVADLVASIPKHGLLQPINVHLMRGGSGKWGAFAGYRRFTAIGRLIDAETLPADWPIPVRDHVGFSDAQLVDLSLVENIGRKDLADYELFAGIRKEHKLGHSVETIAAGLARSEHEVRRWLKMGELAPEVFAAFRDGLLSIDQAHAYAATADQQLQSAVFASIVAEGGEHFANVVRKRLKVGDREAEKLLGFVGEQVYRDAGGRYELDLFAEEGDARGRIVDEGLLRKLADAAFDKVRDATRVAAENRNLRFVAEPPKYDLGTDHTLEHRPADPKKPVDLPDGVVAHVGLNYHGEPTVTYWWENRAAKHSGTKPERKIAGISLDPGIALDDRASPGSAGIANEAIKEEHAIAGDALQAMRHIRRSILRGLLVENAERGGLIGQHYATWAALRHRLSRDNRTSIGAGGVDAGYAYAADLPSDQTTSLLEEMPAQAIWERALARLSKSSFITEPDLAAAFVDYLGAGDAVHRLAGAVVAGIALERSANAPGYRIAAHDALALATRGTPGAIRKLWRPTEAFLGLFPVRRILDFVDGLVDRTMLTKWSKLKAGEQRRLVALALGDNTNGVMQGAKSAAAEWVHPLLAFEQPAFTKARPDDVAAAADEMEVAA